MICTIWELIGIIVGSFIGVWIYHTFLYDYFDRVFRDGNWFFPNKKEDDEQTN